MRRADAVQPVIIHPWWQDVLRGILGLSIVGVLIGLHVQDAITLFRVLGVYLVADGIVDSADLITGRHRAHRGCLDLLLSITMLGIGVVCVVVPQVTVGVLVLLVAARLSMRGLRIVRTAWRAHDRTAFTSWLFGLLVSASGVALALVTWVTFALVARVPVAWLVVFLVFATTLEGTFFLLRGLFMGRVQHRYQARRLPRMMPPRDRLPALPPTTRRAVVFLRRAGAAELGHLGWAFEWLNGGFTAGSVENRAGKLFALPATMDFWATHTRDPLATARHQLFPYDEYKVVYVRQPQPKGAWNTVVWESQMPYVIVRHNCCDVAYDVLRSYGVSDLPDPAKIAVPTNWYDAISGPSCAIRRQSMIPLHLHRSSQHHQPFQDQLLTIPATIVGTVPPWCQRRDHVWHQVRHICEHLGEARQWLPWRRRLRPISSAAQKKRQARQYHQAIDDVVQKEQFTMATAKLTPPQLTATKGVDPWPRRTAIMRGIGAGFGSLAGVCLLFLSFPVSAAHPGRLTEIALTCFAAALPLLAFGAVSAFSLSWVTRAQRGKPHVRRALGATIIFGAIGAGGTVVGIATFVANVAGSAGLAFVLGTVLVCAVYFDFVRNTSRARKTPAGRSRSEDVSG